MSTRTFVLGSSLWCHSREDHPVPRSWPMVHGPYPARVPWPHCTHWCLSRGGHPCRPCPLGRHRPLVPLTHGGTSSLVASGFSSSPVPWYPSTMSRPGPCPTTHVPWYSSPMVPCPTAYGPWPCLMAHGPLGPHGPHGPWSVWSAWCHGAAKSPVLLGSYDQQEYDYEVALFNLSALRFLLFCPLWATRSELLR